jgi:mannan endo-1,4-beta-mannosidase
VTTEAAALLARLDDAYGKSTMVGVYKDRDAQYALDQTGLRPSIMGGDLLPYSPQEVAHGTHPERTAEVERLIDRASEGYIITLSWHWCSPSGMLDTKEEPWFKCFYTEATRFDVAKALADPSSSDYGLLLSDIDTIAVQLRKLQDAHVPVLWRPLHEAEGGWFWWGAKGPKPFIQLWQLLYDRLTHTDGIHNLLWVYTAGGNPAWYPGDQYVDVVGIDAYPKDLRDPESALWDDLRKQFGDRKPLTISEFGGVPDIPRMRRMGEFWSYAVSWSDDLGPKKNPPEELKRIYASSGVATQAAPVLPASAAIDGAMGPTKLPFHKVGEF